MTVEPSPPNPYLDAFLTERPKDGIEIIQNRLRKALKLNDELAEYFKERAHAEDLYAKSLARISKKFFVTDKTALGQMQPIWEMLHQEMTEIYTIHAVMSLKITEDVERPLRSVLQSDTDYEAVKSMDATMQRLCKDYDDRLARLNKHKKSTKPNKEAKLMESTKGVEEVKAHWLRTGPDYIQKHQAVDEHRWENLRAVVQKFEVLQNDQLLKRIEVSNNVLTAASNFNVQDEINAFCAKQPTNGLARVLSSTEMQPSQSEQSIQSLESSNAPSMLSVPSNLEPPVPVPSISEKSSRSRKSGKERKFLSTLVSIRRKNKGDNNGYVNADLAPPVMHHSDQHSRSSIGGSENGSNISSNPTPSNEDSMSPVPTSPTSPDQPSSLKKASSFTGSFASSQHQQPPKVLVDAEGYTIPPPDRAAWPGDNIGSSLHDDDFGSDNGSVFSNQQKLKVDIKNETVKEEDAAHAAVALTRVSSMLKEKSPTASGKRRGRRDQRGTRLLDPVQEVKPPASPFDDAPTQSVQLQDAPVQLQDAPVQDDPVQLHDAPVQLEDAPVQLNDAPVQLEDAPVEAKPMIRVQITESIHCLMKGGTVVRAAVLGEVKIAYHGPTETTRPVCFRLEHVDNLERIAPNTSYITQLEEAGVYKLDTNMFSLAGDSPILCIKYQVKPTDDDIIPIKARPMWKCEQEQTLLLVKYNKTAAPLDVHGVFFMTTVSGNVQNVQSVPGGQWMVDQEKMVWPMGEWHDADERVLRAKFSTKEQGAPQSLAIRFEAKDQLLSGVSVATEADEESSAIWARVESTERSVRTGKYVAE
ncbi:Muniscin C-terminal mu homology domain-containing protein [Fennellomyces sp. T-0311]|nr:Muniscin C-terminal mu homology domain-containing protein [Fennellomyces sp. T-0311]